MLNNNTPNTWTHTYRQHSLLHTYIQTFWFHINNFNFASEIINYKTTYIYEHPVHLFYINNPNIKLSLDKQIFYTSGLDYGGHTYNILDI